MKRKIWIVVALMMIPVAVLAQTGKRFNAYTAITESNLTDADLWQVWNGGNIKNISTQNLWDYLIGTKTISSFTGTTIPNASTVIASLQALETALELKQAGDADLTYLAGVTLSDDAKGLITAANYAAMLELLGAGPTDNPSFNSLNVSGGNLAAANKQVVKAWQTGLPYVTQETAAVHGGKIYICTSSHTAGADTEPGVGADWATVWAEVQGSESMTYPGSGIPISTGSAWGTSLEASSAFQYLRKNAANDGYEFGDLPAYPTQSSLSVDDLITLSGVADGSVNLGQFTGTTIADNQTIKAALQALETALEGISTSGLSDLDDLPGDTVDDNLIDVGLIADLGPMIHGKTSKATPVDADEIPLSDSADTNALKKLTWANLKATLNSVYAAVTGTSSSTFQVGTGGPKVKNNSGVIEARNAADDAYADVKGKDAYFANFYSTAGDGNYYLNINNTTVGGGHRDSPAEGDFDSVDAVMYIYRTSWRTIWDSGNLANPINLADSATAAQPLLSGGSGGDPAYASYVFSGTASQTYTFPSTSKTLAATDGSNLSFASSVLATALSDETGSGVAVFATSPSLTTPNIGAATGTSLSLSGALTGLVPSVVLTHASGVHDGSNDAAVMTDSGESFTTNAMVGMTLYNVTDASSCTVTANDGTTITCTLAGGTDNNWDTNDVWQVGPGPNQSGSTFYVSAASTIRHPAIAGYAAGYYVDGAVAVTVEVANAMTIEGATASAIDAGDTIDSPATANSFIWLHNKSTTVAKTHGKNGTWTDGGAS